jgi:hypothetical protein
LSRLPFDQQPSAPSDPQHAFSEMYKTVVQNYVVERLIPHTPPRNLYQNVTRTFFEELIQNIEISNFGSRHDQQVALFARRRGTKPELRKSDVKKRFSEDQIMGFPLSSGTLLPISARLDPVIQA